jgi:hypothetical protein
VLRNIAAAQSHRVFLFSFPMFRFAMGAARAQRRPFAKIPAAAQIR